MKVPILILKENKSVAAAAIEHRKELTSDQAGRLLVCARNGLGYFDRDMVFHKVEGGLFAT